MSIKFTKPGRNKTSEHVGLAPRKERRKKAKESGYNFEPMYAKGLEPTYIDPELRFGGDE